VGFRSLIFGEKRDVFQDNSRVPTWPEVSNWGSAYSPVQVTRESAIGLPAVGRAITLVSETIANLPLLVYQGKQENKRLRDDTWQFRLLNELPGLGDFTPFDLISDIAACLEASGNAFLQKVKAGSEVVALIVIDPQRVEVERSEGEKRYLIHKDDGSRETLTASTVLHIRGFTVNGSDVGLSPIAMHRQRIGSVSAQEQYVARFYGQGVGKRIAIQMPGPANKDQTKLMMDTWKANHTGMANAHLPALLTNGATVADIGMSLEDAQFAESQKLDLVQVAHIFRIPPKFLTGQGDLNEWDFIALHQVGVAPRLRRIVAALHTDPDLFPDRALYPEFDVRELVRTDAKTKAEVEHMKIQDGSLLPDEVRAEDGRKPLPSIPADPAAEPGMVPQLTPVGGAPNPDAVTP
jgi:HK97 family phage portal protein